MFGTKTGDDDANIWLRPAPGQTLNIEANLVDPLGAVLTNLSITDTTESTSKTTGALKVAGGIGTNKGIFCNSLDCENVISCGELNTGVIVGEWNGVVIDGSYGGTGVANSGKTITIGGNFSTAAALTINSMATTDRILVSSSANTIGQLTTANNGVLITSGTGVPSISSTLPSSVQSGITSVGTIASGTWSGSNISLGKGGTGSTLNATNGTVLCVASGVGAQTAAGSTGQFMLSAGTGVPTWSNTVPNAVSVTNATASSSVSTGSIINSGGIGNSGRIFTNDLTCVNSIVGKNIYCSLSQNSNVTVATDTSNEIFAANGTFTNTSGGFTHNSSTGRITILETGVYVVYFTAVFGSIASGKYNNCFIWSGSTLINAMQNGSGAGEGPTPMCTGILYLTSGTEVRAQVAHNHGSDRSIYGGTFRIAKIVS